MTRRRARRGSAPLLWALGVTAALSVLAALRLKTHPAPPEPTAAPSSAPPTLATRAPSDRAALRWRVRGLELPPAGAFSACLEAQLDAPVTVTQPTPESLTALWSPAASPLVLTALEGERLDLVTPIESPSSAPLRAHAGALSCLRPSATRLMDLDLGRTFDASEFRAGARPGALDPERFFGVEALNGSLMTRGLARFTGYELEVVPDAARGWPQARTLALSAVSVVLAEGASSVGRPLTIGDYGGFTLSEVEAPAGVERVVRLAPLTRPQAAPQAPRERSLQSPPATRRSSEPTPTAPPPLPSLPEYR